MYSVGKVNRHIPQSDRLQECIVAGRSGDNKPIVGRQRDQKIWVGDVRTAQTALGIPLKGYIGRRIVGKTNLNQLSAAGNHLRKGVGMVVQ